MTAVADLRFLAVSATAARITRIGVPLKTSPDGALATRDGADGARDGDDGPGDILRDWQIMQTRLDREEEAEEMSKLWHDDPATWLERSKTQWSARHRASVYAKQKAMGVANPSTTGHASRAQGGTSSSTVKTTRKNRAAGEPLVQLGERGKAGIGKISCSLVDLIQSGLLKSGAEKMFIVYQDNVWKGDLGEDGVITFQGQRFTSPSAWAIFAKRLTNPTKKADDGWKSARYGDPDGPTLDQVKGEYARINQLKLAGLEVQVEEASRTLTAEASAAKAAGGAADSPRATRKRKAAGVVTASADDMSWTVKFPGCEFGAPEPYAGTVADENMDFKGLVGKCVCVFRECAGDKSWWAAKVIKVRDLDTHAEADLLFSDAKIEREVDVESLASEGELVVLDEC